MNSRTIFLRAVFASALLGLAAQAHAVTEIQWWHAQTGGNNERINSLAKQFNDSQSDYKVTAVYKGSYPEAMAAAIGAGARAGIYSPTILNNGYNLAVAKGLKFKPRFMAGQWTPTHVEGDSSWIETVIPRSFMLAWNCSPSGRFQ